MAEGIHTRSGSVAAWSGFFEVGRLNGAQSSRRNDEKQPSCELTAKWPLDFIFKQKTL
jgi:hypothetical protein